MMKISSLYMETFVQRDNDKNRVILSTNAVQVKKCSVRSTVAR